jgi:trans-aconitate 2-methyltransferase
VSSSSGSIGRRTTMSHYTFGDTDAAADRLALLARAYEASSALVLAGIPFPSPPRAVDLGCGPGYTTRLVHRATGARETWGLDASERLVARARVELDAEGQAGADGRGAGITFAVHDATASPFPVTGVDFFYARYLLTHLASPRAALDACAAAAAPGARLLVEDNCALLSEDPLLQGYYERVRAMHAHYGQDMFIGERLPAIAAGSPWTLARFDRTPVTLDGRIMARLHSINVRNWRHDPFATASFDPAEIDAMTSALDAVVSGARATTPVTCIMAQALLHCG